MSRLASRAPAGRLSKERYMMRVVALLVLVWLIVGAIAAFPSAGTSPRRTKLCQRGHDRVDRARRTAQLRGCQPKVMHCNAPRPS